MYNPDVHRGSRRSLDQRVAQTNLGVIRLGCVLLLLGLLVSCTSFVLALVSFNASDTQHLQEQIDTLLSSALEATRSDLSESQTVSQDIGTNLQTLQRKLAADSSRITELSRFYTSLGMQIMGMNESLVLLEESAGNQRTECVEMVEELRKQLRKDIRALERKNNKLHESVKMTDHRMLAAAMTSCSLIAVCLWYGRCSG
jgi:septal ring factor EnvC (AmiA/AmiB activator)